MDAVNLLPPLHIQQSTPQSQSKFSRSSRSRHCNDPQCFIWNPFPTQQDRWAVFDAFHPSEVDDYGYATAAGNASVWSSMESRRFKRAEELRTRAKARLMPPYDPCQPRQARRNVVHARRDAFRTPSPAPQQPSTPKHTRPARSPRTPIYGRRLFSEDSETDEDTPASIPTTIDITLSPAHTPTSTVAGGPSPVPTPLQLPPLRFQSPSP